MTLMQATRPLDPWRWLGWPALLCVIATVLFAAPIRLFGLQAPQPVFPMVVAYAWAAIRPSILGPFVLLLLGVFLDSFWGGRMGVWPLSLLITYGALLSARSVMTGQSRFVGLLWYMSATALGLAAGYLLTAATAGAFPNLLSVLWLFVATSLLYPFAHRLVDRFEDADVRFR